MTDEQHEQTLAEVAKMAVARQVVINDDHPMVQEFWDSFSYLNGDDELLPILDHSSNPEEIAVNLNEYIEVAVTRRQQVPALRDLKKVLRQSRRHKFLDVKTVKSRIRTNASQTGATKASTVHCWVFKRAK
jgi:hypothetical protein